MLSALYGDIFILPGITGIYRAHPASNTRGRKNNAAFNSRRHNNFILRITQNGIIREKLRTIAGEKDAYDWYVSASMTEINFFAGQRKNN